MRNIRYVEFEYAPRKFRPIYDDGGELAKRLAPAVFKLGAALANEGLLGTFRLQLSREDFERFTQSVVCGSAPDTIAPSALDPDAPNAEWSIYGPFGKITIARETNPETPRPTPSRPPRAPNRK